MTSEERLGLQEPADHQCGHIDEMIVRAKQALLFSSQAMQAIDPQTVVQANKETHARLDGFEQELEELRDAIEQVRGWGTDWKRVAKELLIKHEPERLEPPIEFDPDIPF